MSTPYENGVLVNVNTDSPHEFVQVNKRLTAEIEYKGQLSIDAPPETVKVHRVRVAGNLAKFRFDKKTKRVTLMSISPQKRDLLELFVTVSIKPEDLPDGK